MATINQIINPSILVIDDEESIRLLLARVLTLEGYQVDTAGTFTEALALIAGTNYELAFIDIMLGDENGMDLVRKIRKEAPDVLIVIITGRPDVNSAATAVRLGAFDYITKPIKLEVLSAVAKHAHKSKLLTDERERHRANMNAIFSSVSEAIIMTDGEGRLVEFNTAAANLCGYDSNHHGIPVTSINLGCEGICRRTLFESLSIGAKLEINRFECRSSGELDRMVSFTASPIIDSHGIVKGAVGVIRDETCIDNLERVLQQRTSFHGMIGHNLAMQKLYSLIEILADVQTTVLINGDSGTGKELVAAALHDIGKRRAGPMIKLNCSALSETLLESELFGHVRGAFTGAIGNKAGLFENADGGTIFLDEIGDISPGMQVRLLRVLQEREVLRVGDTTPIKVDVRIIAATNQDLAEKVRRGTFRQDLFYRINIVSLELPPLRERRDDIPLLCKHFLNKMNIKFSKTILGVSDEVLSLFSHNDWPGNVRQLEHAIEHACVLCHSNIITRVDLPQNLLSVPVTNHISPTTPQTPPQKFTLEEALALSGGNKSRAARLLGINRRTVYRKLSN